MPEQLPVSTRKHYLDQFSDDYEIWLITLSHASWPEPERFSSDPTEMFSLEPLRSGTVHDGDQYFFLWTTWQKPAQREGADCVSTLIVTNIEGGNLPKALRELPSEATVEIRSVMRSNPAFVCEVSPRWIVTSCTYNGNTASIDLTRSRRLDGPFPYLRFTPQTAPGLFP